MVLGPRVKWETTNSAGIQSKPIRIVKTNRRFLPFFEMPITTKVRNNPLDSTILWINIAQS